LHRLRGRFPVDYLRRRVGHVLGPAIADELLADRAQHAQAVADGVQIADAKPARMLEAADFDHSQLGGERAQVHFCFDLEPVRLQVQAGQDVPPESIVAIAQVRVLAAKQQAAEHDEAPVAQLAVEFHIGCAAALHETGAFREVRPRHQGADKGGDLAGVGGPVGVDHDDDIAGCRRETLPECAALAAPFLHHDADVGDQRARDFEGIIGGVTINQDNFVDPLRDKRQHVRQVLGFIEGRDDYADGRVAGRGDQVHPDSGARAGSEVGICYNT